MMTPLLQRLLEQREITPETQLPPMDFLMTLFDEPCFPRRELVAFTGRAKSGKTLVLSVVMTMGLVNEMLQFRRVGEQPLRVLWYDTEQSDQSTLDIIRNRIVTMFHLKRGPDAEFPKEYLRAFNVRFESFDNRRQAFLELVPYIQPDIVILDGVRDLVGDINDCITAQHVMEELMQLAQSCNCCIICVLHQNKSGESRDPRGWLGTELLNKAFDVFATEKLKIQQGQKTRAVFKLEQLYTRKYDIEQCLYFEVDEEGLPYETETPPQSTYLSDPETDLNDGERPKLNNEYVIHHANGSWEIDVRKLFVAAFEGNQQMTGAALRYKVMELGNIATNRLYNNCLKKAMDMGLMTKSKDDLRRVVYTLSVLPF